ncbi:MAG: uroporphyrinogen-III C-methyltransferase [Pirellulales bacterium]|nr:uroporphyrinogen-III C-methyltransferase [Pirellulales bacterium]
MPESHLLNTQNKVYLIDAGPGDPGLLTLRGATCLQRADVVIYDSLINSSLLNYAPLAAERIGLGPDPPDVDVPPGEINSRMITAVRSGKTVVRLTNSDPGGFARQAEEIAALWESGIPYEIIPGVATALAAAGYAEIPFVGDQRAAAVALIADLQSTEGDDPDLDGSALAAFPGTLVFSLGADFATPWSRTLLEHGKPPETPVVVVRRCTWPDQQVIHCTLGSVTEVIAREKIHPPAVIAVGETVSRTPATSWFAARPLSGQTVLVTRPEVEGGSLISPSVTPHLSDPLVEQLRELGGEVLVQPAIRLADPPDWTPVDRALSRLAEFDAVVFSSAHGVHGFLRRLWDGGGDARHFAGVKLATIGPGTAETLREYGLRADEVPSEFRAEALADLLTPDAAGKRFLLIRASRGREVLRERLEAAGATVEQIVAYSSTDVEQADPHVARELAAGKIDWVTVTSSSIATALVRLFGQQLRRSRLASISPVTSGVLGQLGFAPTVEAREHTMPGLAAAILEGAVESMRLF